MAAGFETYNSNGTLQCSSEMFGYFLRRIGTGTTVTATWGNTASSQFSIPVAGLGSTALVAVQMFNYHAGMVNKDFATGDWNYTSNSPVGTAYRYYVFDRPPASSSGTNLQVFNAAGAVTLDLRFHPLRVIATLSRAANQSYWWGGYYSKPSTYVTSGRSLAGMQGAYAGHSIGGPMVCYGGPGGIRDPDEDFNCTNWRYQNNGKLYGTGVYENGNALYTGDISWDDVQISAGGGTREQVEATRDSNNWVSPMMAFVVDVTGYPTTSTTYW